MRPHFKIDLLPLPFMFAVGITIQIFPVIWRPLLELRLGIVLISVGWRPP